jgi:predicted ArsR family transcriptional regulator
VKTSPEDRTRDRVARTVLENGPTTAAALAEGLGLTPAAVRRHLDALLAEGLVEEREPRPTATRGRGRPARLFVVTDAGRDAFDQAYDDLAASALRFLAETGGRAAVGSFARQRVAELEARYRPVVEAAEPEHRVGALAGALSGDGYAAAARPTTGPGVAGAALGEQLCQHHCPVAHVAEQFPELCEAETEVFARLLGTHVQRLATIAHGDGVCTTFVPRTTRAAQSTDTEESS